MRARLFVGGYDAGANSINAHQGVRHSAVPVRKARGMIGRAAQP